MDRDLDEYLDALAAWGRDADASDAHVAARLLAADERLNATGGAVVFKLRDLGLGALEKDGEVLDRRAIKAAASSDLGALLVRHEGPGRPAQLARGAALLREARALFLEIGDGHEAVLAGVELLSALIELASTASGAEASEARALAYDITVAKEASADQWWRAAQALCALSATSEDAPRPDRRARARAVIDTMRTRGRDGYPQADETILLSECMLARAFPEEDDEAARRERLARIDRTLAVLKHAGAWSMWTCLTIESAALRIALGERDRARGDLVAIAEESQTLARPYRELRAALLHPR